MMMAMMIGEGDRDDEGHEDWLEVMMAKMIGSG